ncbi:MAG: histidine kinase [Microbacterium sp.]
MARVTLTAVTGVMALLEIAAQFFDASSLDKVVVNISCWVVLALYAWRPATAVTAVILSAAIAATLPDGGVYSMVVPMSLGLTVATCSVWLVAAHVAVVAAWCVITGLGVHGGTGGKVFVVLAIAIVAALIGAGVRALVRRSSDLAAQVAELEAGAEAAVQEERDRIADELHNVVAHDVTRVLMQTRALKMAATDGQFEPQLAAIETGAQQAMLDIRRMLRIMHPLTDENTTSADLPTLEPALESFRRVAESGGRQVEIRKPEHFVSLSPAIEVTVVHVVNEAANNIAKHAVGGDRAVLTLSETDGRLALVVENSSSTVRRSGRDEPTGYGLRRLAERAEALGGTFGAGPVAGGWRLRLDLPIG